MLILKPNCECCDKDLPPQAEDARVCTFECTFCAPCAGSHFNNICPNCQGELVRRPIRPQAMLDKYPVSDTRFVKGHGHCPPHPAQARAPNEKGWRADISQIRNA